MSTNVKRASMNAEQTKVITIENEENVVTDAYDFFTSAITESKSELGALFNFDRTNLTKTQQLHLDIFLLSYLTGGSTVYELAALTGEDVGDEFIFTERFESGLTAGTPKVELVSEIIERYQSNSDFDYLLPIFSGEETSHIEKQNIADQMTADVNKTVRGIAAQLGLESSISISSNQRMFIEALLIDFVPIDYITDFAGCSEELVNLYSKNM